MTCELCGKENAVVRIRQIIGNESREIRICESCARKKGIIGDRDIPEEGVAWLLRGLFERFPGVKAGGIKTCPVCNSRFRDIRTDKRAGCANCYAVFRREMSRLLKVGSRGGHRGKLPRRILFLTAFMIDRENLKTQLKRAVEQEDYEQAARLRDEIRKISLSQGEQE